MLRRNLIILAAMIFVFTTISFAEIINEPQVEKQYFIGSTFFMLGNFIPDDPNPPDFVQINVGYRMTLKDVISIEAKTWKYSWPLGIPFGKSFQASGEDYPGYIRDFGIGLVYQRFWWQGAYVSLDAMNTFQIYVDKSNRKIQNGYQLFMTYRLGYSFNFLNNRFFIEPSLAITHWPIKMNVPLSFEKVENNWPNYFLGEPGLHFGINF